MKQFISILCFSIAISASIPSILSADDIVPIQYPPKAEYMVLANQIGTKYAMSIPLMKAVVTCESTWIANASHISKREQSYGLSQVNRLAHPDISIAQAENPTFALTYLAKGLKSNPKQWSCYQHVTHPATKRSE